MKTLDWQWHLDSGAIVRARLELPAKRESVWVGDQLLSRSVAGAKPEGHAVPIGGRSGGAYRGATEARVVFDAVGDALGSCELSVEGRTIEHSRAPRSTLARYARPLIFVSVAWVVALIGAWTLPSAVTTVPSAISSISLRSARPASASSDRGAADRVVEALRGQFRLCYDSGLSQDPSMEGGAVVTGRLGSGGEVIAASIDENNGLSAGVAQCLLTTVRSARIPGSPEPTMRIPLSFVR